MSSEQTQLTLREAQEVVQAASVLDVLARVALDPNADVNKLERIMAMQERLIADQRKTAYMAAMAQLQAELPQVQKDGRIIVKGQERSRYARLEDIDASIRPILAKYGFAFSFNEESVGETGVRFSATLSHREGYSETKYFTVPVDKAAVGQFGPIRTAIQDIGSTASYARRYLIKMHLNLVERDEDNDGIGSDQAISDDQAVSLLSLMDEVKADKVRFLKHMGVEAVADILQRDYKRAVELLEQKRRATQK